MTYETVNEMDKCAARIDWVLDNAGTSAWLKEALRRALEADPVSVGNDVEVLRQLLQQRATLWVRDQLTPVVQGGDHWLRPFNSKS